MFMAKRYSAGSLSWLSLLLALCGPGLAYAQSVDTLPITVAVGVTRLAVDPEGNVFLLNTALGRLHRYAAADGYVTHQTVGGPGVSGEGFLKPVSVWAGNRLLIYVWDAGTRRLVWLNQNLRPSGERDFDDLPLRVAGLSEPLYLNPTLVALGPSGELYAANLTDSRVYKIDTYGRLELSFGGADYAEGALYAIQDIALGPDNLLWVMDSTTQSLKVFDNYGTLQWTTPVPPGCRRVTPFRGGALCWGEQLCYLVRQGTQPHPYEPLRTMTITDMCLQESFLYLLAQTPSGNKVLRMPF